MANSMTVQQRLLAIMNRWPVPITPNCRQSLEALIRDASSKVPQGDSAQVAKAEANFERLLGEMTLQAGQMGFKELHEPTLGAALFALCPIFPFC